MTEKAGYKPLASITVMSAVALIVFTGCFYNQLIAQSSCLHEFSKKATGGIFLPAGRFQLLAVVRHRI
ncbi:MAG: hypothetical protein ACYDH8_09075 [Syntrophales bacterium]